MLKSPDINKGSQSDAPVAMSCASSGPLAIRYEGNLFRVATDWRFRDWLYNISIAFGQEFLDPCYLPTTKKKLTGNITNRDKHFNTKICTRNSPRQRLHSNGWSKKLECVITGNRPGEELRNRPSLRCWTWIFAADATGTIKIKLLMAISRLMTPHKRLTKLQDLFLFSHTTRIIPTRTASGYTGIVYESVNQFNSVLSTLRHWIP